MLLLLLLEMHKVVGVFLAVDWMYISQVIDELGSVDDVIKLLNHQASNSSTLYLMNSLTASDDAQLISPAKLKLNLNLLKYLVKLSVNEWLICENSYLKNQLKLYALLCLTGLGVFSSYCICL